MPIRQRRKPKVGTFPSTERIVNSHSHSNSNSNSHSNAQRRATTKKSIPPWIVLFGFLLYLPILIIVNPVTIPHIFHLVVRRPCVGTTCSIKARDKSKEDPLGNINKNNLNTCSPVDTDRVVFARIPKTATSTIVRVFETFSKNKSVATINLQEIEDVVSSIQSVGAPPHSMGYHDPRPEALLQRLNFYYKRACQKIMIPPFSAQQRNFYEGHFYHFNFTSSSIAKIVGPESTFVTILPHWLKRWYRLERPSQQQLDRIQHITMVRQPQDRLASMYYYDRHQTRNKHWREKFLANNQRGNATLEECLLDKYCVEANELQRWCSLQTEMLCGLQQDCRRPISNEALEIAKENVNSHILFAGVAGRMEDSIRLLHKLLPTYLEGADKLFLESPSSIPYEKQGKVARREQAFSSKAQAVLDRICSMDNHLYAHVDKLLTERLTTCALA